MFCSSVPGTGRGERTDSRDLLRGAVHLGAGRLHLWASSPMSYLAALSAHPVELRTRIGSCRSALFGWIELGLVGHRSTDGLSPSQPGGEVYVKYTREAFSLRAPLAPGRRRLAPIFAPALRCPAKVRENHREILDGWRLTLLYVGVFGWTRGCCSSR